MLIVLSLALLDRSALFIGPRNDTVGDERRRPLTACAVVLSYVKQLACRFHPDAALVEDYRAGDMVCPECGLVVGDR